MGLLKRGRPKNGSSVDNNRIQMRIKMRIVRLFAKRFETLPSELVALRDKHLEEFGQAMEAIICKIHREVESLILPTFKEADKIKKDGENGQ